MQNRIPELYLILKKRLSEEDILKKAEVNKEIFNKKLKLQRIGDDQMALSVYYKLCSATTNKEYFEFIKKV